MSPICWNACILLMDYLIKLFLISQLINKIQNIKDIACILTEKLHKNFYT